MEYQRGKAMSDKYYELAIKYCKERCPFQIDCRIAPECINCQVTVFGEWLDDLLGVE